MNETHHPKMHLLKTRKTGTDWYFPMKQIPYLFFVIS